MSAALVLERFSPQLRREGLEAVEVYTKQGRSRRFEIGPQGVQASQSEEHGWAVRASGPRASLFASGSGRPPRRVAWPPADGYPLTLPLPRTPEPWTESSDLDAPLFVESEGFELLTALASELESELPDARLVRAVLDDGASSAELATSLGVRAQIRGRAATLYAEATIAKGSPVRISELLAEREPRRFNPRLLGRRLADRLMVLSRGRAVGRDRAPCLLAPAVVARVLGRLLPTLVGGDEQRSRSDGQLGSEQLTIVDDPRVPHGLLAAAVDGEGVPTRRRVLVENGLWRENLTDWRVTDPELRKPAGSMQRPSWREPPVLGPSHLYALPDEETSVASLLEAVPRGYYFIEALPGLEVDVAADRFTIPAAGFRVRSGRAEQPVSRAVLEGRLSATLAGVQARGRDLRFFPLGGMVGAPSWLVRSMEVVEA